MASENCLRQIIPGVADKGVLVEVGVLRASNLLALSNIFPEMQIIGVDSFEAYTDFLHGGYTITSEVSRMNQEVAEERIAKSGNANRIKLMVQSSHKASKLIDDGAIDLVYLDKNFTETEQFDDVVQWFPKVRSGGILAGHEAFTPEIIKATKQALDSFSINYTISIVDDEVWYITKV